MREHKEENSEKQTEIHTSISEVITCVSKHYNLGESEIRSISRKEEYVIPRHMAMYFCNKILYPKYTGSDIGKEFVAKNSNGKNHATISHACKMIANLLESDPKTKADFDSIKKMLIELQVESNG